MDYYAYMNKNGLTDEEFLKVSYFVKDFKTETFAELGVNTIYVTFRNGEPFIYKTANLEDGLYENIFDDLYSMYDNIDKPPLYNAIVIDEKIEENKI